MSAVHLLRILSEPPIPVSQQKENGWKTGDVLLSMSVIPPDRFLVLDANEDGRVIALKLKSISENTAAEGKGEYVSLGPKGLNFSEAGFDFASEYIRLNKIYFGGMILDRAGGRENVGVVCHLSEPSMNSLKKAVAQQWTLAMSDATRIISSDATSPRGDTSTRSLVDEANRYETFRSDAYRFERFIDLANLALNEDDYRLIRNYLELPRREFGSPTFPDCHCDGHVEKRNAAKKDVNETPTFWTTWVKLTDCAMKLGLEGEAHAILENLSEAAHLLGYQPGEAVIHSFVPMPCYIANLPTEILLSIIENFSQHWDRDVIFNFGLTCKFFSDLVNMKLYRSISISCQEDKWDQVVKMLPKYGHLTREIYLEAPQWDTDILRRVVFQNLRAIGDFCPNIERLDLNYPLRLDLSATEADLPPKIAVELEQGNDQDTAEPMAVDKDNPTTDQPAHTIDQNPQDEMGNDEGDDDSDDEAMDDDDDDDDEEDNNNTAEQVRIAEQARRDQATAQTQKRVCAELDHIIKNCKQLENFSIQWTGGQALNRFYKKIPKLKALRLWDRFMTDEDIISTGKECRELERFYIEGHDARNVTIDGLIGFLNGIHTKGNSKLKRLGLYFPAPFRMSLGGVPLGLDQDNNDEDMDDADNLDGDDIGNGEDFGDDEDEELPHPVPNIRPADVERLPMYRFLDVLSYKHPNLQRLALIGCGFYDDLVPALGGLNNLHSLDLQQPIGKGLTTVGIARLVRAFQGKVLSSLDLSYHTHLSEDDIDSLTGRKGLKTLRYVRVDHCPKLKDKFLVDEWVHPSDYVLGDGTFIPRPGVGRSSLEIGDGWKEPWNEN